MKALFNEILARSYDRWAETAQGRKAYELEGELLLELGKLTVREKILEVGCGTGAHLIIFLRKRLSAFGLDVSPDMLRLAQKKLGKRAPLCQGDAENLPFKEKTFDCVALITTLEFISDPQRAVQEALRVSKGKVLLGVLNRLSFLGITRRLMGKFHSSIYDHARFYTIWELRRLIAKIAAGAVIDWASVLVLPMTWQSHFPRLERSLSFRRNPLGAFLGLKFWVK